MSLVLVLDAANIVCREINNILPGPELLSLKHQACMLPDPDGQVSSVDQKKYVRFDV